jgi:hypothetical protein
LRQPRVLLSPAVTTIRFPLPRESEFCIDRCAETSA